MGEHEVAVEPNRVLPNGLLPNVSGSVMRVLDANRWMKAEEKTSELIARIQPNQPSEEQRNAVADYVQRLIMKCFPCQVFTFGSVPLKTYLPDGDIDVTAFSKNQTLQETWASQVRDMLESEEKNENAEFHVKEVQYIQAEVKIIKCLVENIVVDISFNQLGGLCTLCFLEEVDHLINHNHLFKRSIILIKSWCYYESRILGAHHGLISTYALETLVLYIFHVFNNTFAGPLEVLYRFLEFFGNFDWDNFCVSLWGPVPISSLPDVTAEPPRKDSGELLLSKLFLDACSAVYAVFPDGQENQGQGPPFISKHFNVIDPLRVNNNLGRSVNKGNFRRIRSALAFGAKRLARLLDCLEEDIAFELNHFFMNTWERHGSGNRPDVPCSPLHLRPSNQDGLQRLDNQKNTSCSRKLNDCLPAQENTVEGAQSSMKLSSQRATYSHESTLKISDLSAGSHAQNPNNYLSMKDSRVSLQAEKSNSDRPLPIDRGQISSKLDHMMNEAQGKHLFARTRSSPELTDTYTDASTPSRRSKPAESGKTQATSSRTESMRKNAGSENVAQGGLVGDNSSIRHLSAPQKLDVFLDSNSGSVNYIDDAVTSTMLKEKFPVIGMQAMQQEEQDRVNIMASSLHNFVGKVPLPLNFASKQLPMPISPSLMASLGYAQKNMAGIVPGNIHLIDPSWASNLQFPQGMIPPHLAQFFPGVGLASNSVDSIDLGNGNLGSMEMASAEADSDIWHEGDHGRSNGPFGLDDANMEILTADDQQPSTSDGLNYVPTSRFGGSYSSLRPQQKVSKDNQGFVREEHPESSKHTVYRVNDYLDDNMNLPSTRRSSTTSQSGSMRNRASLESSWDGSSKASKMAQEKHGRKSAASSSSSSVYGEGIGISDQHTAEGDDENGDWSRDLEMTERSTGTQSPSALHVPRHQLTGFESNHTGASDSLIPVAPILLDHESQQSMMDSNPGSVPYAFYPTGPPVPFLTMLPVYNFPSDTSSADASPGHLVVEDSLDSIESSQIYDAHKIPEEAEGLNTSSSMRRASSVESSEEHMPDILNSDFSSHWKNLQYGRFCQNPRFHGPVIYQSPVVVPPMYLQGRFPWDGPGRPVSAADMNVLSQVMGFGPHLVPFAPVPSVSNSPRSLYQRYADELPRYRSGTGTYLPNPKAPARDRHSSGTRRNSYNYDRSEHHADREGSWTSSPKSRASGRSHNRSQVDKSSSHNRYAANESRFDRPWGSNRIESMSSSNSPNVPSRPYSAQTASTSMAYGMYPLAGVNQSAVSSNGLTIPSLVMLYPCGATGEQVEFGSLGAVGFTGTGMSEASLISEDARMRRTFDEPIFHGNSGQLSLQDQPSSSHHPR